MKTPSKTSKRTLLIVRGMITLLVLIGIAFGLSSTASYSKMPPNMGKHMKSRFTKPPTGVGPYFCDANGYIASIVFNLNFDGGFEWVKVVYPSPKITCADALAKLGTDPSKVCADTNGTYDTLSKTCLCNSGYTRIGDGNVESMYCKKCPEGTGWSFDTGSCTCNGDTLQTFDRKDLKCKPIDVSNIPHRCPVGMQWNDQTRKCDHGCGMWATWNENTNSCVCENGQIFGSDKSCSCGLGQTWAAFTGGDCRPCNDDDPPYPYSLCYPSNAPPPQGCKPGQIRLRNGKCILPKAGSDTTNRSIPPAGLLETTPGLSPQGPAGIGTPSGGGHGPVSGAPIK